MAKVLGLKQLLQKKYATLIGLDENITTSFGALVEGFLMIVWGKSGQGKTNFLMQFIKALMPFGKVLYVSLEEGHSATIQATALRQLNEADHAGKIEFADHEMTCAKLTEKLAKKKSPKFIVIDSIQYWSISYEDYKSLKERFKKKSFIFISHAEGQEPLGAVAKAIRYDVGIKVRVEGYIAFVVSRYGGNLPYVIWEGNKKQGAVKYWGNKYKKITSK